jgi:hypothetical protein
MTYFNMDRKGSELPMMTLFYVCLVLFIASAMVSIWFQMSEESKDERGRTILSKSYAVAFPVVLLGFCSLSIYERISGLLTREQLKIAIWILLALSYTVHATVILVLKRKY